MKSQIREVNNHGVHYQALAFVCPGCALSGGGSGLHLLPVNTTATSPSWNFDGNLDSPTLHPSVLTGRGTSFVCHSFLENGIFRFLGDCTHKYVNQHIPMPDLPDWFINETKNRNDESD